jgi:hypothetical protein
VNLTTSTNDSRGNSEDVGSGSQLPAGLLQVCLSPETGPFVSACPLEELQSRCSPGSPTSLIVATSGSPKIVSPVIIAISRSPVSSAGPQSHKAQEDARQSPPASDLVFIDKRPSPPADSNRCSIGGKTLQG